MTPIEFVILAVIVVTAIVVYLNSVQEKTYRRPMKELITGQRIEISQKIVKNENRIGKFVAFRDVSGYQTELDRVHIGFSVRSRGDKHNAVAEEDIALASATSCYHDPLQLPAHIVTDFLKFYFRCNKYFKGCSFPTAVQVYDYGTKTYRDGMIEMTDDSVGITFSLDFKTAVAELETDAA